MITSTKSMKGGVIWLSVGIEEVVKEDDAEKVFCAEDAGYEDSVIECR